MFKLAALVSVASAVTIASDPYQVTPAIVPSFDKDMKHPMNYFVPNFGVDRDIAATEKAIAAAEKKLKYTWTPTKKTPAEDWPKNYFVPNLGLDKDIVEAASSIKTTETTLNKKWNPTQDKDGAWVVPEAYKASSYSGYA